MKESVAKLVHVILEHLDEPGEPRTEGSIRRWLTDKGYNKRDIEAAMKMVAPRIAANTLSPSAVAGSVRHLAPFEAGKLTPEARNALVRLELYQLINPFEREMLLDRIAQYESEVGLDELDYLLSWLLYSTRDVESQQTIYSIVDGNKATVH